MSEIIGEAFVEIRPLATNFEGEARQQVNQAMSQISGGQQLLGPARQASELSRSGSTAETAALTAAFQKLEAAGTASQENIAAAAAKVRAALASTGAAAAEAGAAIAAEGRAAAEGLAVAVAPIAPGLTPTFRADAEAQITQAAATVEASARITPQLDPSFRQQAQAQLDSAVAGLTEPQRFFASQQTRRELGLSKSTAETAALTQAFRQLEVTGVASATNIAAAATRVRAELAAAGAAAVETGAALASTGGAGAALERLGAQGVQAEGQIEAAALRTQQAILATGTAATEAAAVQVAAARTAAAAQAQQAASLAVAGQAGLRSQGVTAQVANLAALKEAGLLTASATETTRANIAGLESAIAGLGSARVGAGTGQLAQIDAELARLNPELQAAKANFASIVAPVEQVTASTAKATKEASVFGSRSVLASSASAAGLQSVALRYGLVGLAATTAFQALGQAADALDQTGREAFTTEGRVRNLTAALIHQDLIGAFNGLTAVPKTIEEAGISVREASHHVEAFQRVIAGSQVDTSKRGLQEFQDAVDEAGTSSRRLAQEVLDSIPAFAELDAATRTALNSVLALKDAQGRPIVGGFAAQQPGFQLPEQTLAQRLAAGGFPQGPSRPQSSVAETQAQAAARRGDLQAQLAAAQELARIARIRVQIVKAEGPLLEQRRKEEQARLDQVAALQGQLKADAESLRAGTASANEAVASATGDLGEVLRIRQQEAARIASQLAAFKGSGPDRQALVNQQKQATAAVISTQNQIAADAQQAADEAAANRKRQLDAAARELRDDISLRQGKLEIALANAQNADDLAKQRAALQALIRLDIEKSKDTRLDPLERQTFRADIPQRRAQLADLRAGGGDEVQQARLDNLTAAAERTPGTLDNRKAFDAWIKYWQSQIKGATDVERVQLQGRIAALRFDRGNLGGNALTEQRLANRRAAAELTKGSDDNRAAINASIAYWKEQKEGASLLRKAQIENSLIGLRGDLKSLTNPTDAAGEGTTAFDLLTQAAQSFSAHAGNLITKDQPFAGPTGFTADLAQFLKRGASPPGAGSLTQATTPADPELVRAIRENTQALREQSRGTRRPGAGVPPPRSGALERNDRRFWEADNARDAVGAVG